MTSDLGHAVPGSGAGASDDGGTSSVAGRAATLRALAGVRASDGMASDGTAMPRLRRGAPRLAFKPVHALAAVLLLTCALCASLTMLVRQSLNYAALDRPVTSASARTAADPAASAGDGSASADAGDDAAPSDRASEEPDVPAGPPPIDLNTAGVDELDAITGVGPVIARRIVDHRATIGRFTSVDQLLDVSGIGPKTLERMRAQVTVR